MPTSFPQLPDWKHIHLPSTDSTMTRVKELSPDEIPIEEFLLITTDHQTAGHGQVNTHWEAAAGKNLLFSFAFRPQGMAANRQFLLSEALSLSVAEALTPLVGECRVKWPNDVYWHDRKICGMLLDHVLCGSAIGITRTGVGVNVNQPHFEGDAPNPVSVRQILGHDVDRDALLSDILSRFSRHLSLLRSGGGDALHRKYMHTLYRNEGYHPFRDASGHPFEARIADISPMGMLTLAERNGNQRTFAFKEVSFVLPPTPSDDSKDND